ncbi:hypothetical protein TI03_03110 [Achromatium sp. WMS1]|nr:hypothetical protein TI03_03110 [Achromatium sp. WMS1]
MFNPSDSLSTVLPLQSKNLNDFVPKGWTILFQNDIQLTGKKGKNYIFAIEQDSNKDNRIVFVVIQSKKGIYQLNAANSKVVLGPSNSGRFGDMFVSLDTAKNAFTISHYHGSYWNHGSEITFSYKSGQWTLSKGVGCAITELGSEDGGGKASVYYVKPGEKFQNFDYFVEPVTIFEKIVAIEKLGKYFKYGHAQCQY